MSDAIKKATSSVFAIDGGKGTSSDLSNYKLPTGVISVKSMIPEPVQKIISTQFQSVGLNFDVNALALNKDNRGALKDLRMVVDMIQNNAKLLPSFATELKKAMKAATKMAEFNADIVKSSLKEQHKIDEAQADILLALAGYRSKSNKLAMKLELKVKRMQKVDEARARMHQGVFGEEVQLIDAQFEQVKALKLNQLQAQKTKDARRHERKINNQNWQAEV